MHRCARTAHKQRWGRPCCSTRLASSLAYSNHSRRLYHAYQLSSRVFVGCSGRRNDGEQPAAGYLSLYDEIRDVDYSGLRYLVSSKREQFTNSFMFWLADQEKVAKGDEKKKLDLLCSTLLNLTMEVDAHEQAGQLPARASSLASENYRRWTEETGASLDPPVQGASLETLYSFSEVQEREVEGLLGGTSSSGAGAPSSSSSSSSRPAPGAFGGYPGGFGGYSGGFGSSGIGGAGGSSSSGQQGGGSSTISPDMAAFLRGNRQYQDAAAAVMARVKMRMQALAGTEDVAAEEVLRELLHNMASREERCTYLPEAFTPPGMQLCWESAQSGGEPKVVCTTPKALLSVIDNMLRKHEGPEAGGDGSIYGKGDDAGKMGEQVGESLGVAAVEGAEAERGAGAYEGAVMGMAVTGGGKQGGEGGGGRVEERLRSGEAVVEVLKELREDVVEYDEKVYRRLSRLEQLGDYRGYIT